MPPDQKTTGVPLKTDEVRVDGRMIFPRARDRWVFDGRGTTGLAPSRLFLERDGVRLFTPLWKRIFRARDVWIPFSEVRWIEKMLLRGIVFRTSDHLSDGAAFTPTSMSTETLIALLRERGCGFVPTSTWDQTLWRLRHVRSNLIPRGWSLRAR